ncbi:hypothetical protein [Aeromonas hydrophila]|uniref:hypothetical protein n=1 Tax=Aeromonas hydrophila TaxID=644 RepID=UPI003986650B
MNGIEQTLKSLYNNDKKYGELSSLYKLFDKNLGKAIVSHLQDQLNLRESERSFERIYIDFQWIDKIPLASFVNPQKDLNGNLIDSKTELGDLFIQYRHNNVWKNKSDNIGTLQYCHRSLVIQSKLASEDNPIVPIGVIRKNKINSTSKELKLLEEWPEFDLYETSKSNNSLAKNLKVLESENPFAFFGGFTNSSQKWSFGVAKNGTVCDETFSQVISNLANGKAGKDISKDKAWKTISSAITKTCNNRNIPKSVAGKIESRNKTSDIHTSVTYTFPGQLIYWIELLYEKFIYIIRAKKMLVITIDRISYEGDDISRYR